MTILAPADQLKFRRDALTMATNAQPEGSCDPKAITTAAQIFYDFLTVGTSPAPVIVEYPGPSGLPVEEKPLPNDSICSVYAAQLETGYLRDLRRKLVFELDNVSNELKSRGVVPN